MEKEPIIAKFQALVVRPIVNGYLIEIQTENEDISIAFPSLRKVAWYMGKIAKHDKEGSE